MKYNVFWSDDLSSPILTVRAKDMKDARQQVKDFIYIEREK